VDAVGGNAAAKPAGKSVGKKGASAAARASDEAASDPPAKSGATSAGHYVVEAGDTLSSIARQFHTTVEKLQKLNGISGTTLKVGQKLRVK